MALFGKKQKELNLIPESNQPFKIGQIKTASTLLSVVVVGIVAIVSAVIFFLAFAEENKAKEISDNIASKISNWQTYAPVAEQIGDLKGKISQIKTARDQNQAYYEKITDFAKTIPSGVFLVSLDLKNSNLTVQAKANDPRNLYQFYEALKKQEKTFTTVAIASLTKSGDGGYVLNLNVGVK
jgi:Tfp pilus assembly protein PilN